MLIVRYSRIAVSSARVLERKLADFQSYYNAARGHAALDGHTPLTFHRWTRRSCCRSEQRAKSKATVVVFAGRDGGRGPQLLGKRSGATEVSIDTLKENIQKFVASLNDLLPSMTVAPSSGFGLKSFEVAVGVNAKGEVGFLVTGVEVGADATLTLKFER